jgi:hypothetical protein
VGFGKKKGFPAKSRLTLSGGKFTIHLMNITLSPNPFSGLKAMLARILSGGWMGLVLHLLYRRRIEAALTALEDLFAQWKAGTLAPPAAARPVALAMRAAEQVPAGGRQAAVAAAPRARRPGVPAARRGPVARVAAPRVRVMAWCQPDAERRLAPARCVVRPARRRARCRRMPAARHTLARP